MNLIDRIQVIVSASTKGAAQEFQKLEKSAERTQSAADRMGAAFGVSGRTLAAGVAAGAAAIVGSGLLSFLDKSVEAYGNSAKAAGDLAAATGSSAETVSRMSAALSDAGVSAEKTNALLTKFTTGFGKNVQLIEQLGVAVQVNDDGTTDYAATMVAAVDAIGQMGDASQRNAALVRLFGKQGALAFQDLYASGVKLSEAMRLVDKYRVFTADDVRRAAAYDDAVDSLGASFQGLQFTIGRNLVPALTDTVNLFAGLLTAVTPVLDVLSSIPPEVYLVGGAALLLSRNMGVITAAAGGLVKGLSELLFSFDDLDAAMRGDFAEKGPGKFERFVSAVGGVNLALIGITAAFAFVQTASSQLEKSVRENGIDALKDLEDQGHSTAEALKLTAEQMAQTAGFMARSGAELRGLQWSDLWDIGPGSDARKQNEAAIRGFKEQLEEARKALGEYAIVAGEAQDAQNDLNNAVTTFLGIAKPIDGVAASWEDVAAAASEANQSILAQKQAANAAQTALGTYAVSIQQVVEWQKKLAGQPATVEEALNRIQTSFQRLTTDSEGNEFWQRITDDMNTFGDESKIALGEATQAIYDYIAALAATGMATPDIVINLQKLKDRLPDDLDTVVDQAIAQVEGKPNEFLLTMTAHPIINFADPKVKDVTGKYDLRDPTQVKKWMDEVLALGTAPVETNVNVTSSTDPVNVAATNTVIENLTKDRTVDIYFQTHGYNEVKRIIDNLTRDRTVQIGLATAGGTSGGGPSGRAAATTVSERHETTFDLRGSRFEVADPAAFHAEMSTLAAQRRMAGAR